MTSVDNGTTSYIGPITKQVTSATNLSTPDESNGVYSTTGSDPLIFDGRDLSTTYLINRTFDLPTPPSGGTTHTYKMTGYYSIGAVYETWTSSTSPNTTPPSGHTLTFISYIQLT